MAKFGLELEAISLNIPVFASIFKLWTNHGQIGCFYVVNLSFCRFGFGGKYLLFGLLFANASHDWSHLTSKLPFYSLVSTCLRMQGSLIHFIY